MNKKKLTKEILTSTLAFSMGVVLFGCAGAAAPASGTASPAPSQSAAVSSVPTALTITDMKGRTATLEGPATKVVALSAADCEIVYALGAGAALVGRGEYCNYPEDVLDVTVVQSGNETNVEEIIALAPQVVLMNTMGQTLEQVEQLEAAGISVLASEATTIGGTYEAITMIGAALGKDAEAKAMVAEMTNEFAALATAPTGEPKTIYFEVSPLEFGLWTSGGGTFMDEIATQLGLQNAFADIQGWAEISEEQVLERNPDYIVTISMSFGDAPPPEEEIFSRAGWQNLTALQNGNVFALNEDELARPGPRLVDGATALYALINGTAASQSMAQSHASSTAA